MRLLYTGLLYLLTPFLLARLWWKGRKAPAYKSRIGERFAYGLPTYERLDIWLHAVSLGEVIAATPLLQAMLQQGLSVLVTTTTPTGSAQVQKVFGERVWHHYLPYDLPGVLRRFLKQVKPRVVLVMETELWPNTIYEVTRQRIPLLLVNGRLSEGSFKRYLWAKVLFKPLLSQFTGIFVQSKADAERFIALGAPASLVHTLGNMKYDLELTSGQNARQQALQQKWGSDRPVLIAASTHEGEELRLLSALKELQAGIPNLLLTIAPRHPERFQTVYQLALQSGFNTGLGSQMEQVSADNEVIVLDSLGELMGFYAVSDFAFVGGSLVPIGGHNVLEPIALQVPVVTGHYVHNFKAICDELVAADAIEVVTQAADLVPAVLRLYQNPTLKQARIAHATEVLMKNKGAVSRHLQQVNQALKLAECELCAV